MKKTLAFLLGLLILTSCDDSTITNLPSETQPTHSSQPQEGMQRIVASSPDHILDLINQLGEPGSPKSRSAHTIEATFSNNKEDFVSLLEADRRRVMESLTPEQRAIVERDGLEYEPSDSVIADMQFAELLNAEREIQVGSMIYKYYPNGVAKVPVEHSDELRYLDDKTATLTVTPENEGQTIPVGDHSSFTLIEYAVHQDIYDGGVTYGSGGSSTGNNESGWNPGNNPLIFQDGRVVPESCVRDINYNEDNDGGWLQQLICGRFGENVVAINHFSDNKKLTMHFYDQNYLIYSNIGTKLKMQKKEFLIWWNITADEMVQGWETVTLKYELPRPIPPTTFTHPSVPNPTVTTWSPVPYKDHGTLLFHIPFINYDFTTRDLSKAFQMAAKKAFQEASSWSKLSVKSHNDIGLMLEKDRYAYIVHGPHEKIAYRTGSIESKFYAKWFPGTYELQFSSGSSVIFKGVKFDPNDKVELYRGSVYGAIMYKGQWKAARIVKNY